MGQISFQLSMIRVEEHVELAWLVLRALSVVLKLSRGVTLVWWKEFGDVSQRT